MTEVEDPKIDRKSLSVSKETYEKIDAIRTRNRRSFKAELEVIVDEAYDREFGEVDNPQQYRGGLVLPWQKRRKTLAATYEPPTMGADEIIDLFSRTTLHHQAALLRLISRNLILETEDGPLMGIDFDFDVDKAVIVGRPTDLDEELGDSA